MRLSSILVFVLPDELGALECTPGQVEECQEQLATECVAHLSATVGTPIATEIGIDNRSPITMRVRELAIRGECLDWRLPAGTSTDFFVEPDSTASIPVEFVGSIVGACSARFDVVSDAINVDPETGVASVTLSADVR